MGYRANYHGYLPWIVVDVGCWCRYLGGSPLNNHDLYLCIYRLHGQETYRLLNAINVGCPGSDPELSDRIYLELSGLYGPKWQDIFAYSHIYFTLVTGQSVQIMLESNEYTDCHLFNNITSYDKSWE